jgi:hypothetical protein
MVKIAAFVFAAAAAGYGIHALAQSRFDARPSVAPMGTASSNGISFAWFYDASDRTVYVCRTGSGDTVDCKAKRQLP